MTLTLDVGCGKRPRGDVNCDIIPQRAPNFVLCSAEYLPFRENSFDYVMSYYVMEHCVDIVKFLSELYRVSRKEVRIMTDNSLWYVDILSLILKGGARFTYEGHYHVFYPDSLERFLRKLGYNALVKIGNFGTEAEHMKKREMSIKKAFSWLIKLLCLLRPKYYLFLSARDIFIVIKRNSGARYIART